MALITSDCGAIWLHGHQTALITSGCATGMDTSFDNPELNSMTGGGGGAISMSSINASSSSEQKPRSKSAMSGKAGGGGKLAKKGNTSMGMETGTTMDDFNAYLSGQLNEL